MRRWLWLMALAPALRAQSPEEVRAAVSKALPVLERSTGNFVAKRTCVSCHHNILSILTFRMARDLGFPIDPAILSAAEEKTFRGLRKPEALDEAIQATTLNDPTPDESYLLMAANWAGIEPNLTTAVYARRLANWQREGHWVTSDFRPPHSSSIFTATATAVYAIRVYMPDELAAERDACIARARDWLAKTRPASTEDAAFRLLGLVWANAQEEQIAAAKRDLVVMRKPSGGWPQLPPYEADAYSTGEALFALHESGVPANDAAFRVGLKFLLSTQAGDGTWRIRTRMLSPAEVSPKYFTTGFPYGHDEYLSYAGSCWAVMALLEAAPRRFLDRRLRPPQRDWKWAALFGKADDIDPNGITDGGTTVLMMAAPDAEKVKRLLARGAKADPRAVTIAAAYRGTAASIQLLLDAGAGIPPKALVLASMSGDLDNVKLLLARGAEPSAVALSQAVTFGCPEIVRTLIAAGAPAKITEKTGINLLHWAAIANRASVIPVLAATGTPVNATDQNGYTPLMYAATIDFGDTETLKALLKAGADPFIRNHDGRTAREQARHFHHAAIEAALR